MLARLIQFSLTQRLLMLLLMLLLVGGGWQALKTTPIDAFPGCLHHPGQDHRQGGGHDAGGGRVAHHQPDRGGDARHPAPDHAALHRQVRAHRHHRRLRRGHRHLLGAPAGGRAPGRDLGRPARRHRGRHRADDDAAGRDVHVQHRGRGPKPVREAGSARLDHPPRAALGTRCRRREFLGRSGHHL